MNLLFIGDVFASPGRRAVAECLSNIISSERIDLVVANAENAAGGFGITPLVAEELFTMGVDVLTTGNHIWDKREIIDYFNAADGDVRHPARRILRPANYPAGTPGFGMYEGKVGDTPYAVISLQGRVFLPSNDDPFRVADELIGRTQAKIILVDIHAEATSEKSALGWYLDGRVTAVLGTHTHIPTADTRVLPKGTVYQTDVGMTGPYDSVIGVQKELVIQRFLTSMPARWEAASNDVHFCGVYFECDDATGRATMVERIIIPERIGQPR